MPSTTHLLILLAVVLLLFGAGRVSSLMGEFAKGIKSFKKGLADDDDASKKPDGQKTLESPGTKPVERATVESTKAG